MRRVHVTVSGDVQGVGYRFTLQQVAQRAEVVGWVRNLRDGRVEAELEGEDAAVDAVLAWMRQGPPGGHVTGTHVVELAPAPASAGTSFEVRYNSVSQPRIAEVDRFIRRTPATDLRRTRSWRPVDVPDPLFASTLVTLAATTDQPLWPVHLEMPQQPCRDERLRSRLSTGVLLVETPTDLVIVSRGAPARPRLRSVDHTVATTTIPFAEITSSALVEPSPEPPLQFHRLVLTCDRQVIVQPCLVRPDGAVAALAAHGVRAA